MKVKIISGGQTGVDQVGLELAKKHGLETGGTMPAGFRTNAGPRPDMAALYGMVEHGSRNYAIRTAVNVRESDFTVWFGSESPGYRCTESACKKFGKHFIVNKTRDELWSYIKNFLLVYDPESLTINVAGNRFETHPESSQDARLQLDPIFLTLALIAKDGLDVADHARRLLLDRRGPRRPAPTPRPGTRARGPRADSRRAEEPSRLDAARRLPVPRIADARTGRAVPEAGGEADLLSELQGRGQAAAGGTAGGDLHAGLE